jgi:hypothetical protein
MSTYEKYVYLTEEGTWEGPAWSTDPDDDVWHQTGWHARTYTGSVLYRDAQKGEVLRWLSEQGYRDSGDSTKYIRKAGEEQPA